MISLVSEVEKTGSKFDRGIATEEAHFPLCLAHSRGGAGLIGGGVGSTPRVFTFRL